ncbi:MAG: c-type cytochrome [Filimonas sp.]|nr:c-type cytochrome [Filimonas sp.]
MNQNKHKKLLRAGMLVAGICIASGAFADGPPKPSELNNALAITLVCVIAGLALAIGILANVVMNAAGIYLKKYKESKKEAANIAKVVSVFLLCLLSSSLFAEETATAATSVAATFGGLSAGSFYMLISVIGLEIIIILALLYNLKVLLRIEKNPVVATAEETTSVKKDSAWKKIWIKLNNFKSEKEEKDLLLDHDYDGIRELDNKLPPWWLYGFYVCIIFAVVYLWRYEVAHSAPSSQEEFKMAMEEAEKQKEAYLAKAANNIDENSVKQMTDTDDLEAGKKVFTTTCAVCHKADGGGMVGPNLTDDYWLHGGSIKDVFKTIKYGVPDKGMQSWKDNFSPKQIAQLASYVKSLHGTNPPGAKEPQGELYKDADAGAGAATTTDSTKAAPEGTTAPDKK